MTTVRLIVRIGVILSLLLQVWCACPESTEHMSRTQRLLKSDFVVQGKVVQVYTDNASVEKARFEVYCVFKPNKTERLISSELIIANIQDKQCSQTFVRDGEELIVGLRELRCVSAPGSDCDFELDGTNTTTQSIAFAATTEFVVEVSKTCGLTAVHPPEFCQGETVNDRCPSLYANVCMPASATELFAKLSTSAMLIMSSMILITFS